MRTTMAAGQGGTAVTEPALCLHCRAPLPASASDAFCCRGCRHVHDLLCDSGLTRYYELRGKEALAPAPSDDSPQAALWLERVEAELATQGAIKRISLDVQGIQCGACVWLIDALFKREPDGYRVQVNPALGRLSCVFGARFNLSGFVRTLESFGYRLGEERKAGAPADGSLMLRTGICLALAANAMFLSATTYFGLESGPLFRLVQNAGFVITTLSALVGGSYFLARAYCGVKRGVLHLDLPIALGMLLAYGGSVWSLYFDEASANYLDTVSVFIAVMLVGRLLQERLVERNRRQLLASNGASGLLTRRVREGRSELVACTELRTSDELLVCPGELLPVRARLHDQSASCSLDWINGESEPRSYGRGDELLAGAINVGSSAFRATALAPFEHSELSTLLRDDGDREKRLTGDFWDRLARVYVLLVLLATVLGVAGWLLVGTTVPEALAMATAVLVVTCPCAFGIATPLAYELGVAGLRKRGLFVRDGTFFDRAARIRRIVFDKTGTLTTGSLQLEDLTRLDALSALERQVLYTLTAQSNHPKSGAIARALVAHDPAVRMLDSSVCEAPGKGMECEVDGRRYRLGSPTWARAEPVPGAGPVFSVDGQLLAALETVEVLRADAGAEAQALTREGYELWIASGDAPERAHELGKVIGLARERVLGGLTPTDKHTLVDQLDAGDTLMIGDGINDGPALSRALCSGTPAVDKPFVPARADFYYLTPGLSPVRTALHVARSVRSTVRIALVFATVYNAIAVSLCYAGLMRPWLAALLMPASSLLVLAFTAIALSPRRRLWKS